MLRLVMLLVCSALLFPAQAAELSWDFVQVKPGQMPPGFRSTVSGEGQPGTWEVIQEDVAAALPANAATSNTRRAYLAQTSQDPTDEHFPLLIYEKERFADFTLTTRFRTVSGRVEQMAGIAFRIQDEKNYYVVRASSKGSTFRFYRYVNGQRGEIIGPQIQIPTGTWHEMSIECKGNQIICKLDGKDTIPPLTDTAFSEGFFGFWTKSDSVSHFAETKVVYTPRETLAKVIVRDTLKENPRLLDLRIYAVPPKGGEMVVVAAKNQDVVGQLATDIEKQVIASDRVGYGKNEQMVTVTLPLMDRNGDPAAVVRISMLPFKGQTQQNALARAVPIVRFMQNRVRTARELVE